MNANVGSSPISISGHFGGDDVTEVIRPFFFQFKRAFGAAGFELPCKKIQRMSFIWRADGSVRQFNFEGCENIDLNTRSKYISIDVGVPLHRWQNRSKQEIEEYLLSSMRDGMEMMLSHLKQRRIDCDEAAIRSMFETDVEHYRRDPVT